MLFLAGMGQGKSSSSVSLFILPTIESGEDITIICNEQGSDEWRNMIISTVVFSKIQDNTGLTRAKIIKGIFTEEQESKIEEAIAWIESQKGKINFVEIDNYDIVNVKRLSENYHAKAANYSFLMC